MSAAESVALRQLAEALDRRERLLSYLQTDPTLGERLADACGGIKVSASWGSACTGYTEAMGAIGAVVRTELPAILAKVRENINEEVRAARVALAQAQVADDMAGDGAEETRL